MIITHVPLLFILKYCNGASIHFLCAQMSFEGLAEPTLTRPGPGRCRAVLKPIVIDIQYGSVGADRL